MDVKTIKDWENVPRGSFIQDAKPVKNGYRGLWCSMYGSHYITVPKEVCTEVPQKPS